MEEAENQQLAVSKFKLDIGQLMGDDSEIQEMIVTPDNRMARVKQDSDRVRWFLKDHRGEVFEEMMV